MILVGNSRGGAGDLAMHLEKPENEHVEVHELRGFASNTLKGALNEIYAISRGTRCKQFMYSLSLNPPPSEAVSTDTFKATIERVEDRLGLSGQSRAIVFHEKNGRRHCHCVWSRVDVTEMKAIQMSYDRKTLKSISRDLFLEYGWKMPPGLSDSAQRDPKNFTLAEWQQAQRVGVDPRATKTAIQDAWAISDSKTAFSHALEERGLHLARGDRRGFVAVDHHGEVYSIARQAGVKTKLVRERLGDADQLSSASEVKAKIAQDMRLKVGELKTGLDKSQRVLDERFEARRVELVERQRFERASLQLKTEQRMTKENTTRQARFRTGLKGVWDTLRGENRRIRKLNEQEAKGGIKRDHEEKDALVFRHLDQRKRLSIFRLDLRREYGRQRLRLERDKDRYSDLKSDRPDHAPTHAPRQNSGPEYSR